MLAVILGAGEGTRMRPLTYTRPKVMLPVLRIPIIEHIVNSCVEARLKRVIIVTGYKEDVIRSHFDEVQNGAQIEYVTQDKQCGLSLIHISEPTRLLSISYAVFCLKK